jgi:hypothetical protein
MEQMLRNGSLRRVRRRRVRDVLRGRVLMEEQTESIGCGMRKCIVE